MDGYENLANAIIERAADDYRKSITALNRYRSGRKRAGAEKVYRDTKRFFEGDWFSCLTDLDGRMIMKKINKELIQEGLDVMGLT